MNSMIDKAKSDLYAIPIGLSMMIYILSLAITAHIGLDIIGIYSISITFGIVSYISFWPLFLRIVRFA